MLSLTVNKQFWFQVLSTIWECGVFKVRARQETKETLALLCSKEWQPDGAGVRGDARLCRAGSPRGQRLFVSFRGLPRPRAQPAGCWGSSVASGAPSPGSERSPEGRQGRCGRRGRPGPGEAAVVRSPEAAVQKPQAGDRPCLRARPPAWVTGPPPWRPGPAGCAKGRSQGLGQAPPESAFSADIFRLVI